MEKLNTEGLDVFQIEDLQIAKNYPKMDKKTKRGSTSLCPDLKLKIRRRNQRQNPDPWVALQRK